MLINHTYDYFMKHFANKEQSAIDLAQVNTSCVRSGYSELRAYSDHDEHSIACVCAVHVGCSYNCVWVVHTIVCGLIIQSYVGCSYNCVWVDHTIVCGLIIQSYVGRSYNCVLVVHTIVCGLFIQSCVGRSYNRVWVVRTIVCGSFIQLCVGRSYNCVRVGESEV